MTPAELTIGDFLDRIASRRVTPAGGTAVAVVGATGAALIEMACIHGSIAEGAAVDRGSLDVIADDVASRRDQLLSLGHQDAEIVDALFGTDAASEDAETIKRAVTVPITIASTAIDVREDGRTVVQTVSSDVRVDARAGTMLLTAVARAALEMARVNLELDLSSTFLEEMRTEIVALEEELIAGTDW